MNAVLAPSNQVKIAAIIGDEKAARLVAGIEHEHRMYGAPTDLIYGSQTAPREAAKAYWAPAGSSPIGLGDIPTTLRGAVGKAADAAVARFNAERIKKQTQEFEKIREEVARIMTLQGAERDAALHFLITPR
jgi:hypothetical protein